MEEALRSQDATVRRKSIEVLAQTGRSVQLKFFLDGLMDADPAVRRSAAVALGTFGSEFPGDSDQESVIEGALSKALEDEDARVREAACESWIERTERWGSMRP